MSTRSYPTLRIDERKLGEKTQNANIAREQIILLLLELLATKFRIS